MTGSIIVNNLAGLMMITSLLVIGAKRPVASCWFYALQSLVLVAIFATLSEHWMHRSWACGRSLPSRPKWCWCR